MGRGWKVLLVTSAGVFLVSLDVTVVNIAFPAMSRTFSETSRGVLSWVLSGYNIAFAAALLAGGRIADRVGRRRVFFTGLGIFIFASALCGLAPTAGALIAARVLQALGGALIVPASLALVLPEFPPERRSAAIGVWGAMGGIAAATGPTLGSVLVQGLGWRWVFFINAPVGLASYLFGRELLVESRDPTAKGIPDLVGVGCGTLGVGALALAIVQGGEWGYADSRTIAALVAALVLVPTMLVRSRRHPNPAIELSLFRLRFFFAANAAMFFFACGFFAMLFTNVLFLTTVWDYPVVTAGLALSPGPLSAALFAAPAGRLADRVGHRVIVAPGALVFAIGCALLLLQAPTTPDYWRHWFIPSLFMGVGVGLAFPTLNSAASVFLPPAHYAAGSAVMSVVRQIGAALGIAIAVAILGEPSPAQAPAAFDRAWAFLVATSVAASVTMATLYRAPPRVHEPVEVPQVSEQAVPRIGTVGT